MGTAVRRWARIGLGGAPSTTIDKFAKFKLTPVKGARVYSPLVKECYANFECKVVDTGMVAKYSLSSCWKSSKRR